MLKPGQLVYRALTSTDHEKLDERVKQALEDGYCLYGESTAAVNTAQNYIYMQLVIYDPLQSLVYENYQKPKRVIPLTGDTSRSFCETVSDLLNADPQWKLFWPPKIFAFDGSQFQITQILISNK